MARGVARKCALGSRDIRTESNALRAECSGCHWGAVRRDRYITHSQNLTRIVRP
jgi:hypothetical protein